MEQDKHKIIPYSTYIMVLTALLVCTFVSIEITRIELGRLALTVALVIASFKSYLVLTYFMHLKYDKLYIKLMTGFVILLYAAIIAVNFFDYYSRL